MEKISFIVHNLSANPIVRAYPLALALKKNGYNVEIVGFTYFSKGIYEPYKNTNIPIKTISLKNFGLAQYLIGFFKLLKLLDGDYVYAFKPLMTTYFPALIKTKFGLQRKLLLDVEDDELYFKYNNWLDFIYNFFLRGWNNPNSHKNRLILNLFKKLPDVITVVSTKLQKRYGGSIILHGPDEDVFDPEFFDKNDCRRLFSLPLDKKIILFAGVPHKHKGIKIITDSIINKENFILVCAGPSEHEMFKYAKIKLKERAIILGMVNNKLMPKLLKSVDVVPILQVKNTFTESQIPAKLIEAMAMGANIIATPASDIESILTEVQISKRGEIIEFNSMSGFVKSLENLNFDKEKYKSYSKNARTFFLENASVNANSIKYKEIFKDKL